MIQDVESHPMLLEYEVSVLFKESYHPKQTTDRFHTMPVKVPMTIFTELNNQGNIKTQRPPKPILCKKEQSCPDFRQYFQNSMYYENSMRLILKARPGLTKGKEQRHQK